MNSEKTNILVIGTLASGSSALVDMLKEYENIGALPREFDNFRRPGFVSDQLSAATCIDYPNVIDDNVRFISSTWKFIYKSSLWKYFFKERTRKLWDKNWKIFEKYKICLISLQQIYILSELSKKLKSPISFEEKIHHSNEWIRQIGNIYSPRYDFILFNQPLLPWSDPEIWTKVFKPFKLICVYRDPKDQLAEMIRRDIEFSPFRANQLTYGQFNLISIYGNDRKGRFKFLTDALKNRLETIDHWQKILPEDQFMLIDFEGMVKNYEDYKLEIEKFLGITEEYHKNKKVHLDPDIALKNSIGIYKQYLSEDEIIILSGLEAWYNQKIRERKYVQENDELNLKTGTL